MAYYYYKLIEKDRVANVKSSLSFFIVKNNCFLQKEEKNEIK
jgi:hypothetical protein